MKKLIDLGKERYQPDPKFAYTSNARTRLDQKNLAFFVGLIALGLPFTMLFLTIKGTCFYDPVSHFFYAQF